MLHFKECELLYDFQSLILSDLLSCCVLFTSIAPPFTPKCVAEPSEGHRCGVVPPDPRGAPPGGHGGQVAGGWPGCRCPHSLPPANAGPALRFLRANC